MTKKNQLFSGRVLALIAFFAVAHIAIPSVQADQPSFDGVYRPTFTAPPALEYFTPNTWCYTKGELRIRSARALDGLVTLEYLMQLQDTHDPSGPYAWHGDRIGLNFSSVQRSGSHGTTCTAYPSGQTATCGDDRLFTIWALSDRDRKISAFFNTVYSEDLPLFPDFEAVLQGRTIRVREFRFDARTGRVESRLGCVFERVGF